MGTAFGMRPRTKGPQPCWRAVGSFPKLRKISSERNPQHGAPPCGRVELTGEALVRSRNERNPFQESVAWWGQRDKGTHLDADDYLLKHPGALDDISKIAVSDFWKEVSTEHRDELLLRLLPTDSNLDRCQRPQAGAEGAGSRSRELCPDVWPPL
jgi:hypothetical protein